MVVNNTPTRAIDKQQRINFEKYKWKKLKNFR